MIHPLLLRTHSTTIFQSCVGHYSLITSLFECIRGKLMFPSVVMNDEYNFDISNCLQTSHALSFLYKEKKTGMFRTSKVR